MATSQTHEIKELILRSPDIGDGWRQISSSIWNIVSKNADPKVFELATGWHQIRIKPTPEDLMNQIKDWEQDTRRELAARERAEGLFK